MNKKTVIIWALVLVLLAACVLIWSQCGKEKEPVQQAEESGETAPDEASSAEAERKEETEQTEKTPNEAESSGAYILEDEGDVEIVIPEGEASDGF